jgi:AraC-like DNA-binding protein
LHDYLLFKSTEIDETAAFVGSVFCPHKLSPKRPVRRLDALMHHAKLSEDASLSFLMYGAEVTVEPGPLEHFFNVQIQLSGTVATRCGGQLEIVTQGDAAVLSPTEYVSMDWSRDSSMLIFSVSRESVQRKLRTLLGGYLPGPIVFETRMTSTTAAGAGWLRAIRFLQAELDQTAGFLSYPRAIEAFEENLVLSLLYGQAHNYRSLLCAEGPAVAPAHVKRVECYILENAQDSITVEDLTRIAQTSERSLFAGFRRFRGISPMQYLRNVRLDGVRHDLLEAGRGLRVSDVAGRWGFVQLGRFAADYQRKFGELPSTTLRSNGH